MSNDFSLRDPFSNIELYWANCTHNMVPMAEAAGIYDALWHPIESGFTTADEMLVVLEPALRDLTERQDYYEQFNPSNGWGHYETFLKFIEGIIIACIKYPNAKPRAYI